MSTSTAKAKGKGAKAVPVLIPHELEDAFAADGWEDRAGIQMWCKDFGVPRAACIRFNDRASSFPWLVDFPDGTRVEAQSAEQARVMVAIWVEEELPAWAASCGEDTPPAPPQAGGTEITGGTSPRRISEPVPHSSDDVAAPASPVVAWVVFASHAGGSDNKGTYDNEREAYDTFHDLSEHWDRVTLSEVLADGTEREVAWAYGGAGEEEEETTGGTPVPHSSGDEDAPSVVGARGWHGKRPESLTLHPIAELYPAMSEVEFAALVEDIRSNGQREPVWVDEDNRIVDGRHRWRACEALDRMVRVDYCSRLGLTTDAELRAFATSQNLHRRHLSESQRAMVAAQLTMDNGQLTTGKEKGDESANLQGGRVTVDQAAAEMRVSPRSVADAKKVRAKGSPELVKAVTAGTMSVSAAARSLDPAKPKKGELRDLTAEERALLAERGYKREPNYMTTDKDVNYRREISKKLVLTLRFTWVDGAPGNVGPRWISGYTRKSSEGGTIKFSKTLAEALEAIDAWMAKDAGRGMATTESTRPGASTTGDTEKDAWWEPFVGEGCQADFTDLPVRLLVWSGEHEVFIVRSMWDHELFFLQDRNHCSLHEGSGFVGVAKAKAKAEKILAAMELAASRLPREPSRARGDVSAWSGLIADGRATRQFPLSVPGITDGDPFTEFQIDGDDFDFASLCQGLEAMRFAGTAAELVRTEASEEQVAYLVAILPLVVPWLTEIAAAFEGCLVEDEGN